MERLADLVPQITTPLILGGFIVLVLAGLVYLILPKSTRSKLASRERRKTADKVLLFFFILAVLAIVLGFAGYIVDAALNARGSNRNLGEEKATPSPAPTVSGETPPPGKRQGPNTKTEDSTPLVPQGREAIEDRRVSLNLDNQSIAYVLRVCAKKAEMELVLDPKVDKTKVIKQVKYDGKISDILNLVCHERCRWEIQPSRDKVFLYIGPLAQE